MKTFKLKYRPLIIALAYAAVALCVVVFALTLWRCINNGGFTDFYSSVQYILLFAVSVFAPILLLSVIYNSKYILTDKEFITSFGFIKSRFPIANMTKAVFKRDTCQLAIYTGESYMVFRLNEEWQKEFIDGLLSRGKRILYDETEDFDGDSPEPPDDDGDESPKKKKKKRKK